jgi:hypothetical protein
VHEWLKYWKPLADWLVGTGTIFLGIVAIFATRIEHWWRYPKLKIQPPSRVVFDSNPGDPKFLVLLAVENSGGVAENTEVFLQTVVRKGIHSKDEPMNKIAPLSFRWNHREHDRPEIFVTISRGMQRYFTLGALKRRSTSSPESNPIYFQLWTEFKLTPESDELTPGEYIVDVFIGAADAKPERTKIELTVPSSFKEPTVNI